MDLFAEDPDSCHDSDDSNAESYYANSYPEEDTDREAEEDDEEDDEGDWCYVRRGVPSRGGTAVGPGQVSGGERWDDEEYDLAKESDEDGPASGTGDGRGGASAGRRGASRGPSAGAWGYRIR